MERDREGWRIRIRDDAGEGRDEGIGLFLWWNFFFILYEFCISLGFFALVLQFLDTLIWPIIACALELQVVALGMGVPCAADVGPGGEALTSHLTEGYLILSICNSNGVDCWVYLDAASGSTSA